jgi:hypothetical protein
MYLSSPQGKTMAVVFNEVPGVACQLALNVLKKVGWAKDVEGLLSSQESTQQGIKTCEMVHVGMGHESMGKLQYFFRGQAVEVSHVKQQGTLFKEKWHEDGRVFKRAVD